MTVLVRERILEEYVRSPRNPPFAMAHSQATSIAKMYVLKETVKYLLWLANMRRVEDDRVKILRTLIQAATESGATLTTVEADYLDTSKSQSHRLLRYLQFFAVKCPGSRFIASMGSPTAEHIIRLSGRSQ